MPMPQRVQYSDAIEPLVQFIEDTSPDEILDRTLEKLRAGVPTETMLTASALAVTRSTEMPPGPGRAALCMADSMPDFGASMWPAPAGLVVCMPGVSNASLGFSSD